MTTEPICLRHGYGNCKCSYCLPWIARWERELNGFSLFNKLKEEDAPLYLIYEKMRAEHTDLLLLHHEYLEKQYIEHKTQSKAKRKKASSPASSSSISDIN